MSIFKVIVLAIVQGLAELLPVSSSAHVVVAGKLMHLNMSSPQMTLLLVMLHTGTMFAVIVYFWNQWKRTYFSSSDAFKRFAIRVIWATLLTGIIGEAINKVIEKTVLKGAGGVAQFCITRYKTVIVPTAPDLELFAYPAGGDPIRGFGAGTQQELEGCAIVY